MTVERDDDLTVREAKVQEAYQRFRRDVAAAVPGRVLFTKVWGSWSHNCAMEDSDVDFLAVYQWSLRDALRMEPPAETVDHTGPDWQAHEIGKFCRLLLKGNPAVVECLFTHRWVDMEPEFEGLLGMRPMFLNQQTLRQYLGYGQGQLARMRAGLRVHTKGGGRDAAQLPKWQYHILRMGQDALHIAKGEIPVVWKEGGAREVLMHARRGGFSPQEVEGVFSNFELGVDDLKPWSIPESADAAVLDDWLYRLRLGELEKSS